MSYTDCKNGLYIVDKIKIGQSPAIERYLSRKYGLMGNSLEESAVIECVADNINDIKTNFRKVRDMPAGEAKDKAMKEWYSVQLPSWAEKLEKSLPSNAGHDFSVGTKLSYADISIWFLFNEFFKAADVEDILKHRSKLFAVVSNVASNTQLQKHLASRPVTMF
jgi:glutathione S-transferase